MTEESYIDRRTLDFDGNIINIMEELHQRSYHEECDERDAKTPEDCLKFERPVTLILSVVAPHFAGDYIC